jgi:TonB family protein
MVVKRLYASAAYEEALLTLDDVISGADPEQAEEYRALCLLGLGRTREAEQSLERLLIRHPGASFDATGRSPKFISLYREVRRRALPAIAQSLYTAAKDSFEMAQFDSASIQFKQVVALLDDADGQAPALNDLRVLAEGFARLIDGQTMLGSRTRESATISTPAPASTSLPEPAAFNFPARAIFKPPVYGPDDGDVIPPVVLEQRMPAWVPTTAMMRSRTFRGLLEVQIDESGTVISAKMTEPSYAPYDATLVAAARRWRYEPAMRDGQPVQFRKTIAVTLHGPASD